MRKGFDVCVIFGGISSENEVSVITGTMVCNVLKKGGKSVLPVYISHDGVMRAGEGLADIAVFRDGGYKDFAECGFARGGIVPYRRGKPKGLVRIDCAINCCHGGIYEGGAVAGLIGIIGVPLASAGVFESAVFMDKYLTKLLLASLGVDTAEYVYARGVDDALRGAGELGFPVIVKPATLGSSIGIVKAENTEELALALSAAFGLDDGVLIERYLSPKREINCAVYTAGGQVVTSLLEEVTSAGDYLSYDDKYSGGGRRIFPAELDEEIEESITEQTARIYSALDMRGIARFDYILCGGKIYLSEINTVPGSLSQYLLSDSYKSFYFVLDELIEKARQDFEAKKNKRVISTGILNNITVNTCKLK